MFKAIQVFGNGKYLYTTCKCRKCREAIQEAIDKGKITVYGRELLGLNPVIDISKMKITARFKK